MTAHKHESEVAEADRIVHETSRDQTQAPDSPKYFADRDERPSQAGHIDKPFAYHKPSDDGFARITALRQAFSVVKKQIETQCPPSRERSVAITELETAAMWAIKAVVFNDPKSEIEPGLQPATA